VPFEFIEVIGNDADDDFSFCESGDDNDMSFRQQALQVGVGGCSPTYVLGPSNASPNTMFSLCRRRMSSRSSPWSVRGADGIAYTYIMISRSDPRGPLLAPDALLIDLGLDKPCQVSQ